MEESIKELMEFGKEIFQDETNFQKWLNSKSYSMGGIIPYSLLTSKEGIDKVLETLGRLEHGILA